MYGAEFDALAQRWAAIENEHDLIHPDRSECGGVGGCTMMHASHRLEQELIDLLEPWRQAIPMPGPIRDAR